MTPLSLAVIEVFFYHRKILIKNTIITKYRCFSFSPVFSALSLMKEIKYALRGDTKQWFSKNLLDFDVKLFWSAGMHYYCHRGHIVILSSRFFHASFPKKLPIFDELSRGYVY